MKKNGFTNFQNDIVTDVEESLKDGATLEACAVLIAIKHDVDEKYVIDTYKSYDKMMKVIA